MTPENRGSEVLAQTELTEETLTRMIREVEVPLFDALEAEYPERVRERGWQVCGAACLALPEILEAREGIPSRKFTRIIRIYDPPGQPDERYEQTSLLVPLSNGRILFVDPTYELGYRGRQKREGATVIKSFAPEDLEKALHEEYNLVPFFIPPLGKRGKIGLFTKDEFTLSAYEDLRIAMNDGSAFLNQFVGKATGKKRVSSGYWGARVNRVINSVVNFDKRN
jgi:hypothetical protein